MSPGSSGRSPTPLQIIVNRQLPLTLTICFPARNPQEPFGWFFVILCLLQGFASRFPWSTLEFWASVRADPIHACAT